MKMKSKIILEIHKKKEGIFKKFFIEIKKDLKEIRQECKLGSRVIGEFFFGPKKIIYRKLSNPHKVYFKNV